MSSRDSASQRERARVVAVVVAYQRRELLVAALDALAGQSRPVDAVLVVDNASDDGSANAAAAHPVRPEVISLPRNTGGAGGFAVGLAHAVEELAADWVWLMDDDTIPTAGALEALLAVENSYGAEVTLLGSRAVWTDGRDHPMNLPRRRPFVAPARVRAARRAGAMPVRSSSFVSMLVAASAVRRRGLPVADYFIWNDDFEYSLRLLRTGVGLYVPASVVEHRTKVFGSTDVDPGDRFEFEVRNKLWLFLRSPSLGPIELVGYAGSTALRWIRTVVRSRRRLLLVRAGLRGLRAGLLSRPRPTSTVLAGLGLSTDLVVTLERGAAGG